MRLIIRDEQRNIGFYLTEAQFKLVEPMIVDALNRSMHETNGRNSKKRMTELSNAIIKKLEEAGMYPAEDQEYAGDC